MAWAFQVAIDLEHLRDEEGGDDPKQNCHLGARVYASPALAGKSPE